MRLKAFVSAALVCASASAEVGQNFSMARNYIKSAYEKDAKFSVKSIKMTKILALKNGFEAHFLDIELNFKPLNKTINKSDLVFVKDKIFATEIIDIKTKKSMRDELLGEKIGVTYERLKDENDQNCY
ncbi:MAG: hypothetical protein ACFNYB_05835 [Campylobacter sp.]